MLRLIVLACALAAIPKANAQPALVSEAQYQPDNTWQLVVRSEKLGHDILVVIAAPQAGGVGASGQRAPSAKLPAIYALDNGWGVAGPVGQMMSFTTAMSPAYIVSVGYPPGPDHRNTDLLFRPFTENGETIGGGGARFLAFLTDELRPFLEARYPLDPAQAVLFGHSFGGLFAANVLAAKSNSFDGYVIGSASVRYDPDILERLTKAAPVGGGRRVFVAAGAAESSETLSGAAGITKALSGPGASFKVENRLFAGEGHISYYPKLAPEAFAFVLPPKAKAALSAIALSANELDRVTGVYQLSDGRITTVSREDRKLFVKITGLNGRAELSAESPTRFFIAGYDTTLAFDIPQAGQATAVVMQVNGVELRARRQ